MAAKLYPRAMEPKKNPQRFCLLLKVFFVCITNEYPLCVDVGENFHTWQKNLWMVTDKKKSQPDSALFILRPMMTGVSIRMVQDKKNHGQHTVNTGHPCKKKSMGNGFN